MYNIHEFTPNYKIWYFHEKVDVSSTSEYMLVSLEEPRMIVQSSDIVQMVNDVFLEIEDINKVEEPDLETRRFFDILDVYESSEMIILLNRLQLG